MVHSNKPAHQALAVPGAADVDTKAAENAVAFAAVEKGVVIEDIAAGEAGLFAFLCSGWDTGSRPDTRRPVVAPSLAAALAAVTDSGRPAAVAGVAGVAGGQMALAATAAATAALSAADAASAHLAAEASSAAAATAAAAAAAAEASAQLAAAACR